MLHEHIINLRILKGLLLQLDQLQMDLTSDGADTQKIGSQIIYLLDIVEHIEKKINTTPSLRGLITSYAYAELSYREKPNQENEAILLRTSKNMFTELCKSLGLNINIDCARCLNKYLLESNHTDNELSLPTGESEELGTVG